MAASFRSGACEVDKELELAFGIGSGREARKTSSSRAMPVAAEEAPKPPLTGDADRAITGEEAVLSAPVNRWNLDGLDARGIAGDEGALACEAFCFSIRSR